MKFKLFFLGLALLPASTRAENFVQFQEFTHAGREWVLGTIIRSEAPESHSSASGVYVEKLLAGLNHWMLHEHVNAYGTFKWGDPHYEKIISEESILRSDNSTILFVSEANRLDRTVALIRLAHRGYRPHNRQLPYERTQGHGVRIAQPKGLNRGRMNQQNVFFADDAEVKNLMQAKAMRGVFLGLLFQAGVRSGAFWSQRIQTSTANSIPTLPELIHGRIDRSTAAFFVRRMGAKILKKHSDLKTSHGVVVELPIAKFLTLGDHIVDNDLRSANYDDIKFRQIIWEPHPIPSMQTLSCDAELSSTGLNFYRKIGEF